MSQSAVEEDTVEKFGRRCDAVRQAWERWMMVGGGHRWGAPSGMNAHEQNVFQRIQAIKMVNYAACSSESSASGKNEIASSVDWGDDFSISVKGSNKGSNCSSATGVGEGGLARGDFRFESCEEGLPTIQYHTGDGSFDQGSGGEEQRAGAGHYTAGKQMNN